MEKEDTDSETLQRKKLLGLMHGQESKRITASDLTTCQDESSLLQT
jgi:hypothetical protein